MSDRSVLYVGTLINDEVESAFDVGHYSLAGNNKKRGILSSLSAVDTDLTVVSPVWVNNNSGRIYRGRTVHDEELDLDLRIPGIVDLLGINYLCLALTTTLLTLSVLREERPSVVMFYNFKIWTSLPALCCKLLFGTPIVVEYEDGMFLTDIVLFRWVARILGAVCTPFVDGGVCVNRALADRLATTNVAIVRGFPSIGLPDSLPAPAHETDEVVVMFAGLFDDTRGVHTFISVASRVLARRSDVEFWIAGYGPDDEVDRVRRRVEAVDDERLQFFGTLPDEEYRGRLVSADVLVNFQDPDDPISPYTFPSKILDFMATGNVVLSTDMADLSESFDEEIVFDGATKQELTESLLSVVDNLDGYDVYGRRAAEWVSEHCTRQRVGETVAAVVDDAVEP